MNEIENWMKMVLLFQCKCALISNETSPSKIPFKFFLNGMKPEYTNELKSMHYDLIWNTRTWTRNATTD